MKAYQRKALEQSLKLVARSSIVVFIGIFISKVFTYLYRIVIARQFGAEEYGLFSLALMTLGWFAALSAFGLPDGVLRFVALYRGKNQKSRIRYTAAFALTLLCISSMVFGVLLFLLSDSISFHIFHTSELGMYLKAFSILVPVSVLASFYLSLLRAYEKIGWYSFIVNIFQSGSKLGLLALFLFLGVRSHAILLSYTLGTLGMLLLAYGVAKFSFKETSKEPRLSKSAQRNLRGDLLTYSYPIVFLGVLTTIFYWTDSFFIGYFLGVAHVGFYNAAVPLAMLLGFAPDLFMQLFFPLITREYSKNNRVLVKELSKQVQKWIFILNLPLLVLMIVFPGTLLNLFFGAEYLVAEEALRFLAIGALFSSLVSVPSNLLSMAGRSMLILFNSAIVFVLNIILNILLIPRYGLEGAAVSTMVSYILLSILYLSQISVILSVLPLRRKMIVIFFLSLLPLFLVLYIKQFIVITLSAAVALGAVFIVLYFFLIVITKSFDRNDWVVLRAMSRKLILYARR